MKLGIKNFRIFKQRHEFEIKPITLLTGPNNSGKSAFTKLLELLKLGTENLRFSEGRHNLGTFENAVNWSSSKKFFKIDFPSEIDFLTKNLNTEVTYVNEDATEINITDGEISIFNFSFLEKNVTGSEHDNQNDKKNQSADTFSISFNYKWVLDHFYNRSIDLKNGWDGKKYTYSKLSLFKNIPRDINFDSYKNWSLLENARLPIVDETIEDDKENGITYKKQIVPENYFAGAFLINNIIVQKEKENRYALYDIYINGENVTEDYLPLLIDSQDEVFELFSYYIPYSLNNRNFQEMIHVASSLMFKEIHENFLDNLIYKTSFNDSKDNLELVENDLFRLLFKEKFINFNWFDSNEGESFFNQFLTQTKKLENLLSKVDFISAQRGNIDRVLLNSGSLEMNKVLLQFESLKRQNSDFYTQFIKDAFKIFGIEGDLEMRTFENTIMVPYIVKDGKEVSFADLGFGFAQIVPIIIKLAITKGTSQKFEHINNVFIIEEPEANLHPNLQSKLADLFILAVNTFPNLRLVIETHSEYIIRKLQYLTACKEIQKDQSIVYYFNADSFVNHEEPKVKKIEINNNGSLSEEFGPGFFDEAIRLRFNLMKINSEQLN